MTPLFNSSSHSGLFLAVLGYHAVIAWAPSGSVTGSPAFIAKACGASLSYDLHMIIQYLLNIFCTYLFKSAVITVVCVYFCFSLPSTHLSAICSSFTFSPQWSYGFYLIHLQGKQGFQFFCKTEETKRKWMEQFDMAMWVKLHVGRLTRLLLNKRSRWKCLFLAELSLEKSSKLLCKISSSYFLFTSRSNIKPERATANQHNFQMHTFDKNTNCRACKMLLR